MGYNYKGSIRAVIVQLSSRLVGIGFNQLSGIGCCTTSV